MIYSELSETSKRRFQGSVCPICNKPILSTDNVEYVKFQHSRNKIYVFLHTSCLYLASKAEKEVYNAQG